MCSSDLTEQRRNIVRPGNQSKQLAGAVCGLNTQPPCPSAHPTGLFVLSRKTGSSPTGRVGEKSPPRSSRGLSTGCSWSRRCLAATL